MSGFRYVVADVFTDTPLAGQPGRGLHGRARDPRGQAAADRAGDEPLGDGVRATRPRATGTRGSGSSRRRARCRSRGTRRSARRSFSAGRSRSTRSGSRPLRGIVPVRLEREDGRIVFGRMEQPLPTVEPFDGTTTSCSTSSASSARSFRSRSTTTACATCTSAWARRTRSRRSSRTWRRLGESADARLQLLRRRGQAAGRRGCSRPAGGVAEDPATGSAAGPLALHLARHGRIAFGEEIEIAQGVEIGRPSKLYARVDGSADDGRARRGRRLGGHRRPRRAQESESTGRSGRTRARSSGATRRSGTRAPAASRQVAPEAEIRVGW